MNLIKINLIFGKLTLDVNAETNFVLILLR